jgi:hypothetical protein
MLRENMPITVPSRGRSVVEVVDRAQTAGARHVLHDHFRIAGNDVPEMARQQPGIDVVAAARAGADDQIDLLAPVEVRDRVCVRRGDRKHSGNRHRCRPAREHPSSLAPEDNGGDWRIQWPAREG